MHIYPLDSEKEMPRFCFTERMFFYEIYEKDEAMELWIFSKKRLTVDQIISQPLFIYFAEKNKKNIKYQLKYKDLVNSSLEDKNKNSIQLKFIEIAENDTINQTANYKFNVATNYNGNSYDLRIEFPKSILESFENPVIGIYSETPAPFKKERIKEKVIYFFPVINRRRIKNKNQLK